LQPSASVHPRPAARLRRLDQQRPETIPVAWETCGEQAGTRNGSCRNRNFSQSGWPPAQTGTRKPATACDTPPAGWRALTWN
jgi:hypothetical protein